MNDQGKIKELFARYLADQCSREEVRLLLHYFDVEENRPLLESLIRTELGTSGDTDEADPGISRQLDATYEQIKKRLRQSDR